MFILLYNHMTLDVGQLANYYNACEAVQANHQKRYISEPMT